jgi:hypothetical protein
MKRVLIAAAVVAALGASAPAVFAQTAETPETDVAMLLAAATPEGASRERGASEQRRFRLPSERVEARLAYLHTALKITDAQKAQWDGFASVLRKHASAMDQRIKQRMAQGGPKARGERPQVSAIERLERQQVRMQERSARLGEVISAAKPLYATFSPEQKQTADEMIARGGRGGHGRGQHRQHRGGGMHRGA